MTEIRKLTASLNLTGDAVSKLGSFGLAVNGAKQALGLLVGAFGLAKDVLFDFTSEMANQGDEIAKSAKRATITAESFQELAHAAELAGSSGAAVEKGIQKLAKGLSDAKTKGTGPLVDSMKALGLSVKEFDDLSPDQAFEKVADILQDIPDDMDRMAVAQDLLGRSGKELLPLLEQGSDAIRAQREEAQELGIFTNEQAAASEELVDAQLRLTKVFESFKITIASELMPVVQGIIDFTREWLVENRELINEKLQEWIQAAIEAGRALAPVLRDIGEAVIDLIPFIIEIAEETGIFITQVKQLADDIWQTLRPAWEWMSGAFESAVGFAETIGTAFDTVRDSIIDLTKSLGPLGDALLPIVETLLGIRGATNKTVSQRGLTGVKQVQVRGRGGAAATAAGAAATFGGISKLQGKSIEQLENIAKDPNRSDPERRAAARLATQQAEDAVFVQSFIDDTLEGAFSPEDTISKAKPGLKRKKKGGLKLRSISKGSGRKETEPLSDEDLLGLINQAASSGESLTGLIGDRKVPQAPPVIAITINRFEQDIDINAPVTVNGVPGTSAEEVANITTTRMTSEIAKMLDQAKESLNPKEAI